MAYFDQAPYVRHVEKSTHTILGSNDAPTSAEWHSENEAAQAETSALAATGEVEDVPVAGVSTAREDETHPYFVWNPKASQEERPVVERREPRSAESGEMSEYMERFHAFTAMETVWNFYMVH